MDGVNSPGLQFPFLVERGMGVKDSIPAATVSFQEVFVRSQRCPCGGFYASVRQEVYAVDKCLDRHVAQCEACERKRPFFFKGVRRSPTDFPGLFERLEALLAHGLDQLAAGDLASAERCLREVVALEPWFGAAHYHLGMIALMTERLDLAKESLETALGILPLDATVHEALAELWTALGDEERAARAGWLAMQIEATLDSGSSKG